MTTYRLYNLYRRAGNGPCAAFRMTQQAQPGVVESALNYAAAVVLTACAAVLVTVG